MSEKLAQEIDNLYGGLKKERNLVEPLWEDVAKYVIPFREGIKDFGYEYDQIGKSAYDGTPISAAKIAADGYHSNLVSPTTKWFNLIMERKPLNEIGEVREWLQDVSILLYQKLSNSSFYNDFWNYLYDGISIGTSTIYMERDAASNKMVFETVHPREIYIDENQFKEVDTVFRRRRMTAKILVEKFGIDVLPERVKIAYKQNPYNKFYVIHAVFKRKNYDINSKLATKKKWASIWKLEGEPSIIKESGYDFFPYAVWRYSKLNGRVYGTSPAILAMVDIKSLNSIAKDNLQTGNLLTRPPMNVPSELAESVNLRPGGTNVYSESNRLVSPINMGGDLNAGINRQEDIRKIVEERFNVDFFFLISRSERQMTATEAMEREGEKAGVISASVGRVNTEALDNIINFTFDMLADSGELPPPPPVLQDMGGENIKIEYMGQLAKAQRRLMVTQGIRASIEEISPLIQIKPDAIDNIDVDETIRELLIAYGYPENAIRSKANVEEIRQLRQQQQQAAQAMEEAQGLAELGKSASIMDRNAGTNLTKKIAGGQNE